jgi:glycosyltransferase involved in cell wall biosynthesis
MNSVSFDSAQDFARGASPWVLIPAFNEERMLGSLIRCLKDKNMEVLVVDDGSTDRTASIAENAGAAVLKNDRNLGKGGSLKKGIEHLMRQDTFETVVTMDGGQE